MIKGVNSNDSMFTVSLSIFKNSPAPVWHSTLALLIIIITVRMQSGFM